MSVDDTNAESQQTANDMLGMFEQFYEFYGRTIELEFYESTGLANDEVTARADAVRIAEDFEPFVVLGGPALTNAFADELAARDVMCIGCTPGQPPEWYAERDPYVYGLAISAAQVASTRHRVHLEAAGRRQRRVRRRRGVPGSAPIVRPRLDLVESGVAGDRVAAFEADLAEGGAAIVESLPYTLDPATIQAQASQIIAKLKSSGVSTVILVSDGIAPRDLTNEATAQEYFPEWIIAAPALSDLTAFGRTYDQTQWANAVAIRADSAVPVTPEISGFYGLYEWFMGAEPPAKDTIGLLMPNYTFLAANLQATGPNLTPETFRDALFAGGGTTPALTQPLLTYGDKGIWPDTDYNGVDDATLVWWDRDSGRTRRDPQGGHRHVGVRRRRQALPARRVADGEQTVRPGRRRHDLRGPAAGGDPAGLPQPRRLSRTGRSRLLVNSCGNSSRTSSRVRERGRLVEALEHGAATAEHDPTHRCLIEVAVERDADVRRRAPRRPPTSSVTRD